MRISVSGIGWRTVRTCQNLPILFDGFISRDDSGNYTTTVDKNSGAQFHTPMSNINLNMAKAYLLKGNIVLPAAIAAGTPDRTYDVRACDTNGTEDRGDDDLWYNANVELKAGDTVVPYVLRVPEAAARPYAKYLISGWSEAYMGYAQEAMFKDASSFAVYRLGGSNKDPGGKLQHGRQNRRIRLEDPAGNVDKH